MIEFGPAVEAAIRARVQREGLALHVASYGGSGLSYTAAFLHRQRRCMTAAWHSLLNHYAVPLDLGIPRLVLLADPPTAYASLVRRDNRENVTRLLHGGQYGQDTVAGMVEFFDRWTAAPGAVIVKYEALYDHLGELEQLLGLRLRHFPAHRPRKSHPLEPVDPRLLELRRRFEELPTIITRT